MAEVYDKKTKTNHWVLTLMEACAYMVRTTKEKGRKIEGTRSQVHFGYFPAWSVWVQLLVVCPRCPPLFSAGHSGHQRRQDLWWIILGFCP